MHKIAPINVPSYKNPETNKIFYTPENDVIFRTIFGSIGNENITKAMLQSIYNKNIEDIKIRHFVSYVFCDDITFYVIELSKYIAEKEKCTKENKEFTINPWLEFFINPLGKEVEEAMRTEKELRLAVDLLKKLNMDDEVRYIAEREEQIEFDRMAAINDAKAIAMAEGRAAEMSEIVVKCYNSGMKKDEIAKILERDIEEIEKIISNSLISA